MKPGQNYWWRLFVLFVFCSPVLAQPSSIVADNGENSSPSPFRTTGGDPCTPLDLANGEPATSPPQPAEQKSQQPYGWHLGVYPILAWAPVFGASVTLPPIPSNPAEIPTGSTDSSLNGAYFGGARFEKGKWSADALFMWAALHAHRETPFANVKLDFIFGDALVGREVLPGLYVEGGFRRLALNIHATVESDSASGSPGFWDPLVGLTYRRELGGKWRILIHGDGGGFGVGSDIDVTAAGRGEWQFARHFGLAMGYGGMHFSETDTENGKTLKISPTMHGPILGFGIFF